MDTTEATNPAEELEVVTDENPELEADPAETEAEDSEQEQTEAEADDEYDEEERDGKKYKLPKWVQTERMLHRDYTQKTQSLAEERRAVQQDREAFIQEREISAKVGRDEAVFDQITERLDYLRTVDTSRLPPPVFEQYRREVAQLENDSAVLSDRIYQTKAELQQQQAARSQEVAARVWREVQTPNPKNFWDGKFDATRREELTNFALSIGFQPQEVENTNHPVQIQVLNLAKIGLETLKKQQASLAKPKVVAQPVKEVTGRRSAPNTGLNDSDDIKTWMEKRNKQIAAQNRR